MFTSADLSSLRQRRRDLAGLGANIKLLRSEWAAKSGFDPNQPRVPAGHPDGGQWTDGGGNVIRLAQIGPRRPTASTVRQWPGATLGQQTRFESTKRQADTAIARVQRNESEWRPSASYTQTIEGQIRANEAATSEANARYGEHLQFGIGPGRFAGESIPLRGPGRHFTAEERREINRIGSETGCHTCGTRDPGRRRTFFIDHQLPNAWNSNMGNQRGYPHCATCSYRQGGWMRWHRYVRP
ncbi:MAG: hypothetical protein ACRCVA_00190 [Phreatobacter sp.]